MGAVLDWYTEKAVVDKWKVMRVNLAPGNSNLLGLHPDVLRILFKSGT